MYNFIFIWMYRFQKSIGNDLPREVSSLAVALTFFIHFMLLLLVLSITLNINLFDYLPDLNENSNRLLALLIGIIYCYLFSRIYSLKRTQQILTKFDIGNNIHNMKNYILLCLIIVLPFVLLILIRNHIL